MRGRTCGYREELSCPSWSRYILDIRGCRQLPFEPTQPSPKILKSKSKGYCYYCTKQYVRFITRSQSTNRDITTKNTKSEIIESVRNITKGQTLRTERNWHKE